MEHSTKTLAAQTRRALEAAVLLRNEFGGYAVLEAKRRFDEASEADDPDAMASLVSIMAIVRTMEREDDDGRREADGRLKRLAPILRIL